MEVRGETLIGGGSFRASGVSFGARNPAGRTSIEPDFASSTIVDADRACELAAAAAVPFRLTTQAERADLLETIAAGLEARAEPIVARALAETGLPLPRLENELGRTANQLRLFARVLRDGGYLDVRIDPALPERIPPRPDLRLTHLPLGPVAVFGASNFPLAFSVAGGDTASALAAGCPVVVKAHPAHPGTSELVGRVVQQAVADCGLPAGVFGLLFDAGFDIGAGLVADPRIQAVGFTGSRRAGLALADIAQARAQPIPVYAEMSSINPVILLPGALRARAAAIGKGFAAALTLGAGQFCTNPGLVLALDDPALADFVAGAGESLAVTPAATMLTEGIFTAYRAGIEALEGNARVVRAVSGAPADGWTSKAAIFVTTASEFLADESLTMEVFGACSLVVRCADAAQLEAVLAGLEGQLTIAVHAEGEDDLALARQLMPVMEAKAGRILFDGFGTGVEVCDAMVHGGPYPATSDSRSTSVGSLAIMRFLRPVCFQDVPDALLPPELQAANPQGVPRRVDGVR